MSDRVSQCLQQGRCLIRHGRVQKRCLQFDHYGALIARQEGHVIGVTVFTARLQVVRLVATTTLNVYAPSGVGLRSAKVTSRQ